MIAVSSKLIRTTHIWTQGQRHYAAIEYSCFTNETHFCYGELCGEQQEIGNTIVSCSFLPRTYVSLRVLLSFFWQSREPINMLLLIGPVWEQCRPLLSRKLKKKHQKVASGKFQKFLFLMKTEIQATSPAILYSLFPFPIRTGIQKQAVIKNLHIKSDFSYQSLKKLFSLVLGKCQHQLSFNLSPRSPTYG